MASNVGLVPADLCIASLGMCGAITRVARMDSTLFPVDLHVGKVDVYTDPHDPGLLFVQGARLAAMIKYIRSL